MRSIFAVLIASALTGGPIDAAMAQEILGTHLRYRKIEAGGADVVDIVNILRSGKIITMQITGKPCAGQTKNKRIGDEAWLGRSHAYEYDCGGTLFKSDASPALFANGVLQIERNNRSSYGVFNSKTSIRISGRGCSGEIVESFDGRHQGSWRIVSCEFGVGLAR